MVDHFFAFRGIVYSRHRTKAASLFVVLCELFPIIDFNLFNDQLWFGLLGYLFGLDFASRFGVLRVPFKHAFIQFVFR